MTTACTAPTPSRWTQRLTPSWPVLCAALLMLALMLGLQPAQAQTYRQITGDQLERIMQAEGYAVKRDSDGDIVWTVDGLRWLVMVSGKGNSIMAKFSVSDKVSLERINEWNRTKRFSRCYLDTDGDANLQLDLELDGGISKERIVDFFRTASISRTAWMKAMF